MPIDEEIIGVPLLVVNCQKLMPEDGSPAEHTTKLPTAEEVS